MARKKKKYQPKMTADEYKKETGQRVGNLKRQSEAYINGAYRPSNG